MDLRHLATFVAICEAGSINRAAQRLGLSQPSVSNALRALEDELGVILFDRLARGVRPTPQGETFYPHCQRVLAEADAARKAVTADPDRLSGPINVGLAPTAAKGLVPKFLASYLADHPDVQVRIAEAFSGPLTEWTLSGEVDFAIVAVPPIDRRLTILRIASEPIVLVAARNTGRPGRTPLRLCDGPALKLVLPSPKNGLRTILDSYIHANDLPVSQSIAMDSLHGMLEFVKRSEWVTLLSVTAIANELERGEIEVRAIEPPLELGFYLIHPAGRALSRAALRFIERLQTGFERSRQDWLRRQAPSLSR